MRWFRADRVFLNSLRYAPGIIEALPQMSRGMPGAEAPSSSQEHNELWPPYRHLCRITTRSAGCDPGTRCLRRGYGRAVKAGRACTAGGCRVAVAYEFFPFRRMFRVGAICSPRDACCWCRGPGPTGEGLCLVAQEGERLVLQVCDADRRGGPARHAGAGLQRDWFLTTSHRLDGNMSKACTSCAPGPAGTLAPIPEQAHPTPPPPRLRRWRLRDPDLGGDAPLQEDARRRWQKVAAGYRS